MSTGSFGAVSHSASKVRKARTVLINADDLGLHRDIDRGILQCIDAGVVQSVSFCVQGRSLDWTMIGGLRQRGVRVGLHLTLVGEPWGTNGWVFRGWKELLTGILRRPALLRAAILREAEWQLQQAMEQGICPDHLDSHQHVHVFPVVWEIIRDLACRHRIARLRVPRCPRSSLAKRNVAGRALQYLASLRGCAQPGHLPCMGLAYAGNYNVSRLERELGSAGVPDCVELITHPGINTPDLEATYRDWQFNWTGERDALLGTAFKDALRKHGWALAVPASSASAGSSNFCGLPLTPFRGTPTPHHVSRRNEGR